MRPSENVSGRKANDEKADLIASLQSINEIIDIDGPSLVHLDSTSFFVDESLFLLFVFEGDAEILPQSDPRTHRNINVELPHCQQSFRPLALDLGEKGDSIKNEAKYGQLLTDVARSPNSFPLILPINSDS